MDYRHLLAASAFATPPFLPAAVASAAHATHQCFDARLYFLDSYRSDS